MSSKQIDYYRHGGDEVQRRRRRTATSQRLDREVKQRREGPSGQDRQAHPVVVATPMVAASRPEGPDMIHKYTLIIHDDDGEHPVEMPFPEGHDDDLPEGQSCPCYLCKAWWSLHDWLVASDPDDPLRRALPPSGAGWR